MKLQSFSFLQLIRLIGLTGAGLTLLLYTCFVFFIPYSDQALYPDVYGVAILMSLLALLAGWAALKFKPGWLLAAFLLSFFPVGLYLLGMPGLFRWIGLGNLLYLLAGLSLILYRRQQRA
jgi:hypothetical protein